jgi:type II secretory pathway component GspD/PulD (secretin)
MTERARRAWVRQVGLPILGGVLFAIGLVLLITLLILAGAASPAGATNGGSTPDEPAPVTLSVQNLEITEVLSMLAGARGLNVVCEGEITGRVSLDLHEVPFDEALRAAVGMAGYEVIRRGNIYFVRRADGDHDSQVFSDFRTYRLDFAKPEDIKTVLDEMLSSNGKVVAYDALRSLVVQDRSDVLDKLGEVIETIDQPPRQVLIEAEIIGVILTNDMKFGVDWSLIHEGTAFGQIDLQGFAQPATGGGQGFFGRWEKDEIISFLETMEGVEDLNTLAAPKVLAIDGADAEIIIGGQLGFSVVTTVENTVIQSVEFLDTGAQLRLTPTITSQGQVLMEIHPELSDGVIQNGLPSKSTTQVSSKVLIPDGQTLFIGGLIRQRDELVRKGVPFLVRLPVIGLLFGRTTHAVRREEIVVLITPHIVPAGAYVPYTGAGMIDPERMR